MVTLSPAGLSALGNSTRILVSVISGIKTVSAVFPEVVVITLTDEMV